MLEEFNFKVAVKCDYCNKKTIKWMSDFRYKIEKNHKFYCSAKCQHWQTEVKEKQCPICLEIKPIKSFIKWKKRDRTGYTINCRKCWNEKKKPYERNLKRRFNHSRTGAKRRGLEWNIDIVDFDLLIKQNCVYCDERLSETGTGLDRIDNDKGYIYNNIVPCCARCNRIKSDCFSYEEMLLIGTAIKEIENNRKKDK